MKRNISLLILLLILTPWAHADFSGRTEVEDFIASMHAQHGFEPDMLRRSLESAQSQESVLKAIQPPSSPTQRSWQAYRGRFVNARRIRDGLRFWQAHAATLRRAEQEYGVPREIIAAIIGVETEYGRNMGRYRVLDALATLAFDYPPRAGYFRKELEELFLFSRDHGLDPTEPRGSYAGAIGLPQFMPGSYRRFAVDFNDDGRIDLRSSPADAIGSVANFLKEHGWREDGPVAMAVEARDEASLVPLLTAGIRPQFTAAELDAYKLRPQHAQGKTVIPDWALIDLATPGHETEYWLGFDNFYALTRYNRSSFYAMSVHLLARELKRERNRMSARASPTGG